jgi:hypothetical protein
VLAAVLLLATVASIILSLLSPVAKQAVRMMN